MLLKLAMCLCKPDVICFQVEEFIAQLGIRGLSPESKSAEKRSPVKQKLKTAKRQGNLQLEDDKSPERVKTHVMETKKKRNKYQKINVLSTTGTAKTVDWISDYQPRKYLLVKPGGKWCNERVNYSSFQS